MSKWWFDGLFPPWVFVGGEIETNILSIHNNTWLGYKTSNLHMSFNVLDAVLLVILATCKHITLQLNIITF